MAVSKNVVGGAQCVYMYHQHSFLPVEDAQHFDNGPVLFNEKYCSSIVCFRFESGTVTAVGVGQQ